MATSKTYKTIGQYRIPDKVKGDTFDAILFTFTDSVGAIDLTDCTAKMQFRRSKTSGLALELNTTSGLTLTDAENGVLQVDEIESLSLDAGCYVWDIEITFPDDTKKTYIEGTMEVLQDVSRT